MDFLKLVFLVLALSALSTAAPQGQQCLSCTIDKAFGTDECKDSPRIRYCSEKCSYFVMLGRGDGPNYDKPYIVRGCSTDGYMRKFGRGTQREYSSKPVKHSIVKRILVFKR